MNIYLISGLGADERLFQYLKFPEDANVEYLEWVNPVNKSESLQAYCQRMTWRMEVGQPHIIIGISFGGIVAQELAKITNPSKVILIASIKHHMELPPYFKAMKSVGLHWILGPKLIKSTTILAKKVFGVGGREATEIFSDMVHKTPDLFIPWAIEKVLQWQKTEITPNLVHIHGTNDLMFPHKYLQPGYTAIQDGTHAMSITMHKEVSQALSEHFDIASPIS